MAYFTQYLLAPFARIHRIFCFCINFTVTLSSDFFLFSENPIWLIIFLSIFCSLFWCIHIFDIPVCYYKIWLAMGEVVTHFLQLKLWKQLSFSNLAFSFVYCNSWQFLYRFFNWCACWNQWFDLLTTMSVETAMAAAISSQVEVVSCLHSLCYTTRNVLRTIWISVQINFSEKASKIVLNLFWYQAIKLLDITL